MQGVAFPFLVLLYGGYCIVGDSMTIVDFGRFASQFSLLEQASLQLERQAAKLQPARRTQQPVHVVYGGAHMFQAGTIEKLNRLALRSFDDLVTDGLSLNELLGESWEASFAHDIYQRVHSKLQNHAVEDYRIDFEDGYGARDDVEEDRHASQSAVALVEALRAKKIWSKIGIRIKPLSVVTMKRSIKTLLHFVETFCASGGRESPLHQLVITLPKVTSPDQVRALVEILEQLESQYKLPANFFVVELLIETPQAVLAADGRIPLPALIEAARGRCASLHFGLYDFTSSLGIGSAGQAIDHVACDFARMWMQISASLAPGVGISDGIINILPLPKHRGENLTDIQQVENKKILTEAWRYNYQKMMRSLDLGFYQGWDLHPAQVPIRHVANHVYVLREMPNAIKRMLGFLGQSAQASRVGALFDDRASVLGLLNFADRGMLSGILSDVDFKTNGVDLDQLRAMI